MAMTEAASVGVEKAPVLRTEGLTKFFGGLCAVRDFDIEVPDGALHGLIGPNGAGKTTVFNMVTGLYAATEGSADFMGHTILGLEPHRITQQGIARTFQNIRIFPNLTVLDNVRIAYHPHAGYGLFDAILRTEHFERRERALTEEAQDFLAVFGLDVLQDEIASSLPYGQQRRLEIARALAAEPKLLLLDEPAAGMNPQESRELAETVRRLRADHDLTVLIIEHDMPFVMGLCPRLYVLDHGLNIATGTPDQIRRDERVVAAYLGERRARG